MSETDNIQFQKPKTSKSAITKIVAGVIIVFLIPAILWPVFINLREYTRRSVCTQHLTQLGKAMLLYGGDNIVYFPTADKWCDLLVKHNYHNYAKPESFICEGSDAKLGESSYAINKNITGRNTGEISPDAVLLFETNFGKTLARRQGLLQNRDWYKALYADGYRSKDLKKYRPSEKVYKLRWNQAGGPELVTFENHKGQWCNVVFHDLHIEFVKPEQLGELNWEDK